MTMSTTPAACAGDVKVSEGSEFAVTVAATPPIVTVALLKPVPVAVIAIPPAVGPDCGLTPVTTGGARKVKALVFVAVPPPVVTDTSAGPAVFAGVVAMIEVALAT